ncbi:MAG: hypothetical protein HGB26_06830 [Desulfobulbaceae bacterium]|nr:hypothetical protein [Desulfobulbaceae bacterium]
MSRSKEEWMGELEAGLPLRERIVDRNKVITAHYAAWYLQEPDLFKWSGMAAFASRQVGIALVFSELMHAPEQMIMQQEIEEEGFSLDPGRFFRSAVNRIISVPSFMHSVAARQLFLTDLDEIRRGNNNIYSDIAWAHAAYLECGIAEIEKNCGVEEDNYMLKGFRMIDEGASLLKKGGDNEEARRMIWEGNVLLLRHEQITTLQPVFDAISPQGRIVVSFGSELDFSGAVQTPLNAKASFSTYSGYFETLAGIKSVTNAQHRWQWIEKDVLPAWSRVDGTYAEDSLLKMQLESFVTGESGMVHQVKQYAANLFRIPGIG